MLSALIDTITVTFFIIFATNKRLTEKMKNSYKKILSVVALLLTFSVSFAQFAQTDQFDYWEDQSTHGYTLTGTSMKGAYICPGDSTLRLGNCAFGLGSVSVNLNVTTNADSIKLSILHAIGGPSAIYVDNVRQGTTDTLPLCVYHDIIIPNAATYTSDGIITVKIADTILTCRGDIQLSRIKVYSTGSTVGIPFSQNDNAKLILSPNPSNGIINVNFNSDKIKISDVTVLNIKGQIVYKEKMNPFSGKLKNIDLSDKANGMYFVKITTGTQIITRKITLQNN